MCIHKYKCNLQVFQTIYLIAAFCDDLLSRSTKRRQWLSSVKDYLFFSLVIPCASFTTISFWSLYNVKKEFVLPEGSEIVLPYWLNHMVHTNTLITVVIEFIFHTHRLPSKRSAFLGLALVLTVYDYM